MSEACKGDALDGAGVTLVAYSVSRIVTEKTDEHSDRLLFYGEPTPESIGPLRGFLDDGGTFSEDDPDDDRGAI